jgi:hypothetical protein
MKTVGPCALVQEYQVSGSSQLHKDLLANQLLLILRAQHPCQNVDLADPEEQYEDADEIAELDGALMAAGADCVAAMAVVLGADFAVYFQHFFPLIKKFAKKTRTLFDRSMAVGSLAEITEGLESGVT